MIDNPREHIRKIRDDFQASQRVKDSLNNSIQALANDLYSKDAHFIFELIQNAEDNDYLVADPSLSFRLVKTDPTGTKGSSGALIIQNNEIGFSPANIDAICAVGKTTKSKIEGYIGEKGIGFKSVFRVTSNPYIFSNGYSFCMPEYDKETGLGFIVPQWIDQVQGGFVPSQTTIILPLDKTDFDYGKTEEMLRDIKPETILFLSKLKEIKIKTDSGDDLTILKDDRKAPKVQIMVEGIIHEKSFSNVDEFLLYNKTFDRPSYISHEKRVGIDKRDCAVAFSVSENEECKGKLFAYLPVRSDTGLPFLINADFILPSSREEILDIPWNRWLMDCVAELTAGALPQLKGNRLLTIDLLESLASGMLKIIEDSMFYPIVVAVREALMNEDLLPADGGIFVSARNAKLASAEWLRKLLRDEQLRLLFMTEASLKWISGEVTEKARHDLWKFIREELKVEEVTPDSFVRKVDSLFFKKQTDEWFIEFYKQLVGKNALWKKASNSWLDSAGPLRAKPFIRLQDGSHVKPFRDDDSPNAYLPAGANNDTSLPIVKVVLTEEEDARRFFTELGIPELDSVAEVFEHIIPKYSSSTPPVSSEEHKRDIEKVRQAYKTDSQEKKQRLKKALQETAFILAKTPDSDRTAYRKPSEVYFPNETLKIYFSGNSTVGFVSSGYEESALDMFKDLGVSEDVRVCKRCPDHRGFIKTRDCHGSHERGLNGFDPMIQVEGLKHALALPSLKRSTFIWNRIAIPNYTCIRGIVESSSKQTWEDSSKENRVSDFGRLLAESPWLSILDGTFVRPCELRLVDLPDSFNRDDKLADLLGMKKDDVAILAEKAGIPAEDIELMRQHPEEFQQWKTAIAARNEKPMFPTRTVANPERRQERLAEQLADATDKEYEERERSVRTTMGSIDPAEWLRNEYTNEADQMVCQICKNEMPFKKRDGEYYFEAVEALSRDHFAKEHEAQYLALCPLCAAKYKEFIKHDEVAMKTFKNTIVISDRLDVPLVLGSEKTSIRFVETHHHAIRNILMKE